MNLNFLDFERPVVELDLAIEELRLANKEDPKIAKLEKQRDQLLKETFSKLSSWQVVQLARHPQRPHSVDYIKSIFTEFDELHGDRMFSDDAAIMAGLAYIGEHPVMLISEEKGRTTKEKVHHNFGLPRPEGYRKALRLMKMAERFKLPIITFIDTQGAYPGIDAEERGQSEAIARNLFEMSTLKTPIICVVIGEGGSGGALAIGVGDRVMMMEYSIYSVISPEGCASILWRSRDRAAEAAESMKLRAEDALKLKLIDGVLKEPLGGAHRNSTVMSQTLKSTLLSTLSILKNIDVETLVKQRYARLMQYGLLNEDVF
jgi:acetyl-CoA carboxylase carboxyl transferase subunit alpha